MGFINYLRKYRTKFLVDLCINDLEFAENECFIPYSHIEVRLLGIRKTGVQRVCIESDLVLNPNETIAFTSHFVFCTTFYHSESVIDLPIFEQKIRRGVIRQKSMLKQDSDEAHFVYKDICYFDIDLTTLFITPRGEKLVSKLYSLDPHAVVTGTVDFHISNAHVISSDMNVIQYFCSRTLCWYHTNRTISRKDQENSNKRKKKQQDSSTNSGSNNTINLEVGNNNTNNQYDDDNYDNVDDDDDKSVGKITTITLSDYNYTSFEENVGNNRTHLQGGSEEQKSTLESQYSIRDQLHLRGNRKNISNSSSMYSLDGEVNLNNKYAFDHIGQSVYES